MTTSIKLLTLFFILIMFKGFFFPFDFVVLKAWWIFSFALQFFWIYTKTNKSKKIVTKEIVQKTNHCLCYVPFHEFDKSPCNPWRKYTTFSYYWNGFYGKVLSLLFPPHPNYEVHPNYSLYKYTHMLCRDFGHLQVKKLSTKIEEERKPRHQVWFLSFFTHQDFKFELWTFVWAIIVIAIPKYNIVQCELIMTIISICINIKFVCGHIH